MTPRPPTAGPPQPAADIDIPDDVIRAFARAGLAAAAPLLIAAELRRIAGLMETYAQLSAKVDVHQTHLLDAQALRRRADELDGIFPVSLDGHSRWPGVR